MAPGLRCSCSEMQLVIVKKGALATFRFLERACGDIPDLRVIWDRRRASDRRIVQAQGVSDRRSLDRRQKAPHTWAAADHLLVDGQTSRVEPPDQGGAAAADTLSRV